MSLVFSLGYAQEASTNQKVVTDTTQHSATTPNAPQVDGSKVMFKDGSITLLEIKNEFDEGGSIVLTSLSTLQFGNKFYNKGGSLYWGNKRLSISGSSDHGWTISGNTIYNANLGNVGIGTTNPLSKLSVGGDGVARATIFGEASATVTIPHYGGYFKASGSVGRGVYGKHQALVIPQIMVDFLKHLVISVKEFMVRQQVHME